MIGRVIFDLRDELQPMGRLKVIEAYDRDETKGVGKFKDAEVTDDIRYDKGVAGQTYGDILADEGEVGKALEDYTKSLAIFRSLNQPTPTGLYRFAVASGCSRVAIPSGAGRFGRRNRTLQ